MGKGAADGPDRVGGPAGGTDEGPAGRCGGRGRTMPRSPLFIPAPPRCGAPLQPPSEPSARGEPPADPHAGPAVCSLAPSTLAGRDTVT